MARIVWCSAVLYGASLSTIADATVGAGPAHSKTIRGVRVTVLTEAPFPPRAANASRSVRGRNLLVARLNPPGGP